MASLAASLPLRLPSRRVALVVLAFPLSLLLLRLLPSVASVDALRLAVAAATVLILPGALVSRSLGRPSELGVAVAAAVAWSLAILFLALTLAFAAEASLGLAIVGIGVVALAALLAGAAPAAALLRADLAAVAFLAAAGGLFGVLVWVATDPVGGDGLFHLARARKLDEFHSLYSVRAANEFRDGGLHPGYAFPLWHGLLAVVARLSGLDVAEVVRYLGAVLVPLALIVAYGVGCALLRSRGGGVATALVQAAQLGFSRSGTGSFELLALPATAARLLLVPVALALVFTFVFERRRTALLAAAAAGLALALVHPTYGLLSAVPLAGFLIARLPMAYRQALGEARRTALALAALVVPVALYSLWTLPVLNATISHDPTAGQRAEEIAHYAGQIELREGGIRLDPGWIARGGPIVVAGLLAAPLAVLAGRRQAWTGYVVGGTLIGLALSLSPQLFEPFADALSLSQARRLVLFLPLVFAVAGALTLLGRLRWLGVACALGLGAVLELLVPGEFGYQAGEGGPGWVVWLSLVGSATALVYAMAAFRLQRRKRSESAAATGGGSHDRWVVAASVALVLPIAVGGFADVRLAERSDPYALTPGLVHRLRATTDPRQVVLSTLEASYRVAASSPLYVVAMPPSHVARTLLNAPYHRRRDVIRFFFRDGVSDRERRVLLRRYHVGWVLVDRERRYPRDFLRYLHLEYEDGRYALYRVGPV